MPRRKKASDSGAHAVAGQAEHQAACAAISQRAAEESAARAIEAEQAAQRQRDGVDAQLAIGEQLARENFMRVLDAMPADVRAWYVAREQPTPRPAIIVVRGRWR